MKKLIYLTMAMSLSLASCSDFLDEPNETFVNNAYSEGILPSQKLAGAQVRLLSNETAGYNDFGNQMTYTYGLNSGFTSSSPNYNFNISSGHATDGTWDQAYLRIDNLQDIIDTETQYPDYANHMAIAKILKVQGMEKIIKLFGDAPYTEAFSTTGNITPKYDDDKQIIANLFLLLDNARTQITTVGVTAIQPGAEDVVFAGDMLKWYQYANTIELRMILSLSNVTDANLVTLRTNRIANLVPNFISEDVSFNPGFNGSTQAQLNPIFNRLGTNLAGTSWLQANRANAAGYFIADVVNGTANTTDINSVGVTDPRRSRMFNLIGGVVTGAIQGTQTQVATLSRLGSFVSGFAGPSALINAQTRDGYAMLAAESFFLQAEAAQRGYISGSAQALFNQGITASFDFYSKPFGDATFAPLNAAAYIAASDAKNGLGWTGSADKINAIMTQKWLALSQWTGIEPYFDMNRTSYPKSPVPILVSQTTRPNRLIYSSTEYSANSANVPSVVLSDIFTVNSKTPYYLQ